MNDSTRSIDVATKDMRDYALYSTVAVWVGTALLIITLVLTLQANKAAMKAANIALDANLILRQIESGCLTSCVFITPDGQSSHGQIGVANMGRSYVRVIGLHVIWAISGPNGLRRQGPSFGFETLGEIIRPGESQFLLICGESETGLPVYENEIRGVMVVYRDAFGDERTLFFCLQFDRNAKRWKPENNADLMADLRVAKQRFQGWITRFEETV